MLAIAPGSEQLMIRRPSSGLGGWRCAALLALLACAWPAGVMPAQADNLLTNGGFESGFRAPWGVGQYGSAETPWLASGNCAATATLDASSRHSGRYSLHLANPTPRAPHVYASTVQRLRIIPNQRYRISLWARGRNLAARGAVTVIVDAAWTVRPIALPAGTFGWTRLTGTFQLASESAEFRILTEDRGEAWLDDIVIEPEPAPAATAAADTPPPFHPGLRWQGRFWDGWDFRTKIVTLKSDGTLVYALARWRQDGSARDTGTLEVRLAGPRLSATRRDAAGRARQYADGIFTAGGQAVSGLAWDTDTGPGGRRVAWWATVETDTITVAPHRSDLNAASVAMLESIGLSPRAARTLVEGRLVWGNYRNLNEALAAPGLTAREKNILREQTSVR